MLSFLEEEDLTPLALPPAPRRALLRAIKAVAHPHPPPPASSAAAAVSTPVQLEVTNKANKAPQSGGAGAVLGGDAAPAPLLVGYAGAGREGEDGEEVDRMCFDPITMVWQSWTDTGTRSRGGGGVFGLEL